MTEVALRDTAVVDLDVVEQGLFQLCGAVETGLCDDLGDAAVEAFDQAIGLRVARWTQPVLDAQGTTAHVEVMVAAGCAGLALEAVREARAVVSEQFDDAHWSGCVQPVEEVHRAGDLHVGIDVHEHPASGAVDGDVQVAPGGLVGHLRQVLDVHVHEAGLVIFERLGLGRCGGIAVERELKLAKVVHTVAAQTAVQRGARHVGANELARDDQQIVQGQQQQAAQFDDDGFLGRTERGAEFVRPVAEIGHARARLPLGHGRLGNVVAPSQLSRAFVGCLDFGSYARRGARLGMDLGHVLAFAGVLPTTSRMTSLARSRGQLRIGQ